MAHLKPLVSDAHGTLPDAHAAMAGHATRFGAGCDESGTARRQANLPDLAALPDPIDARGPE